MNRGAGVTIVTAVCLLGVTGGCGPLAPQPLVSVASDSNPQPPAGARPAAASTPSAARPRSGAADSTPAHRLDRLESDQIITVFGGNTLSAGLDALDVAFYGVAGLAVDPQSGALYLIDKARSTIFRVDPNGRVQPFAGTQVAGFGGDYQPATKSPFHVPAGLTVDPASSELLVADTQNRRVRIVSPEGLWVSTLAGSGMHGTAPDQIPTVFPALEMFSHDNFRGDGGPAVEAELNLPSGVAMDRRGVVFIADSANHRIRAVNRRPQPTVVAGVEIGAGHIATVAGTGELGFSGDGGSALAARLAFPTELAVDSAGNLLIVDTFNHRIRRLDRQTGRIETVVRGSLAERSAEESTAGWMVSIAGVAVDSEDRLLYSDRRTRTVYRQPPGGEAEALWVAGPREAGLGSVAAGPGGRVYVADLYYNRVLRVDDGEAVPYAGGAPAGTGIPVGQAAFSNLGPVAVDPRGDLYLADVFHYSLRRVRLEDGTVETFMGTGRIGTGGDGGPPAEAQLVHPTDILIEDDGSLYVADQYGNAVRSVSPGPDGARVATVAGGARVPRSTTVEDGPADAIRLGGPLSIARHPLTGELYIACQETHTIRKLGRDGMVTTIAGSGVAGFAGEGTPAVEAELNWPAALAFDRNGVLYVSDMLNNRIRSVTPDGLIHTFAGTGEQGFGGDGGPARSARLAFPGDLVFDRHGNLLVSDTNNHRVRRIAAAAPHRIETVVGTGLRGFDGDGGPPSMARLNLPRGLAFGPDEVLYIVDSFNRRVRAAKLSG